MSTYIHCHSQVLTAQALIILRHHREHRTPTSFQQNCILRFTYYSPRDACDGRNSLISLAFPGPRTSPHSCSRIHPSITYCTSSPSAKDPSLAGFSSSPQRNCPQWSVCVGVGVWFVRSERLGIRQQRAIAARYILFCLSGWETNSASVTHRAKDFQAELMLLSQNLGQIPTIQIFGDFKIVCEKPRK